MLLEDSPYSSVLSNISPTGRLSYNFGRVPKMNATEDFFLELDEKTHVLTAA